MEKAIGPLIMRFKNMWSLDKNYKEIKVSWRKFIKKIKSSGSLYAFTVFLNGNFIGK